MFAVLLFVGLYFFPTLCAGLVEDTTTGTTIATTDGEKNSGGVSEYIRNNCPLLAPTLAISIGTLLLYRFIHHAHFSETHYADEVTALNRLFRVFIRSLRRMRNVIKMISEITFAMFYYFAVSCAWSSTSSDKSPFH
eukprot:c812_g1_i1.p1 GENE.c812_g1_i1~~c812_g1_i1.p1  ORF type:complete len:137 (+),score=49.07 c812_g1_i1:8-418(+)